jgi:hypothetical protein
MFLSIITFHTTFNSCEPTCPEPKVLAGFNKNGSPATVTHAWNPSYSEAEIGRNRDPKPARGRMRHPPPNLQNNQNKMGQEVRLQR